MRARYKVEWESYTGDPGVVDDYGNEIESWDAPVDRYIFGVNFPDSDEPGQGINRVVVDRVLLVPKNFTAHVKDRCTLPIEPDRKYEVVGIPEGAEGNPFGWNPGGRLGVVRVDG